MWMKLAIDKVDTYVNMDLVMSITKFGETGSTLTYLIGFEETGGPNKGHITRPYEINVDQSPAEIAARTGA